MHSNGCLIIVLALTAVEIVPPHAGGNREPKAVAFFVSGFILVTGMGVFAYAFVVVGNAMFALIVVGAGIFVLGVGILYSCLSLSAGPAWLVVIADVVVGLLDDLA